MAARPALAPFFGRQPSAFHDDGDLEAGEVMVISRPSRQLSAAAAKESNVAAASNGGEVNNNINGAGSNGNSNSNGNSSSKKRKPKRAVPPFSKRLEYSIHIHSLQTLLAVPLWYRGWKEYFYPPSDGPDIVKSYECRRSLPVRIFFPSDYDKASPETLPTLMTIHGGGWCVGMNRDDDEWNRAFADSQKVLVVSLNYSKSPQYPFPVALHDIEALYNAVVGDESLPIARAASQPDGRNRVALLGFSSGGNLALAMPQLPGIKGAPDAPSAAVSVYGSLDLSRDPFSKLRNRFYKPSLPPPVGSRVDGIIGAAPVFEWCYVPYGHDLTDPLLSPALAPLEDLPRHVFLVAAELDMLAHESWRTACRLANEGRAARGLPLAREVPDPDSRLDKVKCVGKRASSKRKGVLEDTGDERFAWTEVWDDGSVGWLLVPDVIHAFDNAGVRQYMGPPETQTDAAMKTAAYQKVVGEWLHNVVWK